MISAISFIIEWENAKLSELDRAKRMLAALSRQAAELAKSRPFAAELLVFYDEHEIKRSIPADAVEEMVDKASWPGTIAVTGVDGLTYYDQKNHGATVASHPVIVFLDSDVIPDDGWLAALVAGYEERGALAIGGEAYLARETVVERIWAQFWMFGSKPFADRTYESRRFYANNVMFDRETFLRHLFVDTGGHRGQCVDLAHRLRDGGVTIWRQGRAAVSHPPPQGFVHSLNRAVSDGHGKVARLRERGLWFLWVNPLMSLVRLVASLGSMLVRMVRRLRAHPSDIVVLPLSLVAGIAYYLATFAGELMSMVRPAWVKQTFKI